MAKKTTAKPAKGSNKRQSAYREKRKAEGVRQLSLMVPNDTRATFQALAKAVKGGEEIRAAMRRLGGSNEPPEWHQPQPPPAPPTHEPPKEPEPELITTEPISKPEHPAEPIRQPEPPPSAALQSATEHAVKTSLLGRVRRWWKG